MYITGYIYIFIYIYIYVYPLIYNPLPNSNPPPDYKQGLAYIYSLAYNFCLLIFGTPPISPVERWICLTPIDPHLFYDDIAAAREEDEAVVEDFYEAATDVEYTGFISAESNEGVEKHAGGDDMGFDDDDEHAEDHVRDDHWGVVVA